MEAFSSSEAVSSVGHLTQGSAWLLKVDLQEALESSHLS